MGRLKAFRRAFLALRSGVFRDTHKKYTLVEEVDMDIKQKHHKTTLAGEEPETMTGTVFVAQEGFPERIVTS